MSRGALSDRLAAAAATLDDASEHAARAVLPHRCAAASDPRAAATGAIDPRRWAVVCSARDEHQANLIAHTDVRGVGISFRRRGGCWTPEPCLTVYVRRKRPPGTLRQAGRDALPRVLEASCGASVPIDVVEAGGIRRRLSCGARIGRSGLSVGQRWGTLGLVARDCGDGRVVAITAMHLSGLMRFPPGDPLDFHAADGPSSTPVRLGRLLQGTMDGIDAAKVSIDHPVRVDDFLPGIGPLRVPRAVGCEDLHRPVQLYGARSRYQPGFITDVAATFPGDALHGAFLVAMRCGDGDSGAVCCDLGGAVLGLYVGSLRADRSIQVFCPIMAVLDALGCTL